MIESLMVENENVILYLVLYFILTFYIWKEHFEI